MDKGPEPEFLLYCFGIGINEGEDPGFEQLSDSDWNFIAGMARIHKVAPLLYSHFKKNSRHSSAPPDFIQQIKNEYLYNFRNNTRIYNELSKALKVMNEHNIPAIILKGAALAELIYQDTALRPMHDVDIVVKPEDACRIDEVLKPLGYKSDALSEHHAQWFPHIVKNKILEIDINPSIFELPKLDPWSRARPTKIAGNDTFILGPEDFILHLLLHLDRHYIEDRFCSLIWWFDVKELLEKHIDEIDWKYVVRTARENQAEESTRRVFHAINRWFGVDIPPDFLGQLKEAGIITAACEILEPPEVFKRDYEELDSVLSSLSFASRLPSFRKKVHHVFKRMFPDKSHMIQRYSIKRPKTVYFYYFIRAYEVFIKGIKVFLKLPVFLKDKHN